MAMATVLPGCEKDRVLPNGYDVVFINSSTVIIGKSVGEYVHTPVIGPRVREIGVNSDLVYGEVVTDSEATMSPVSRPGFFILDTKTGKKDEGLTKTAWEDELSRRGVQHIRLRNP